MSYQIFNEASLGKFIELIQNKVKSMVDNANVASATNATNATNDADGNAIKTTYRKVSDSYSKSEVDAKVSDSSSIITITTDDLIANYSFSKVMDLLMSGKKVYLELTSNDPVGTYGIMEVWDYGDGIIEWGYQFSFNGILCTLLAKIYITNLNEDKSIRIFYESFLTNTFTTVSTISIAASAWNSTSKTATVSVSGVTADNAVDVAPAGASFDDYVNAGIRATAQSDGKLTFMCKTIPTKAISVNIKAISTKTNHADRNVK